MSTRPSPFRSPSPALVLQLAFTRPVAAVLRGDIIALMSAYKKLEVPEDDTPKKKKKSIPKGMQEAQIDQTYEDIKKVQKTL